ncbi:MAG: DUF6288 domain-containing protein [Planctomycetota bacterium]
MRTLVALPLALRLALAAALPVGAAAQVHYHEDGGPWKQRARSGPDAEVDGWLYNLGVTGLRVRLDAGAPTHLVVGHVFADSPASRRIEVGDRIVGAGGRDFGTPHRNGYGMDVFGPQGPIDDFATALDAALGSKKKRLRLRVQRDGDERDVALKLPRRADAYERSFPEDCDRTETVRDRLYEYLLEHQRDDGSWGNPVHDTFAPLALLGSGERSHRSAVEANVRYHARRTSREDDSSLVNWKYMAAAIVMSEWYLATGDRWVLKELQEVYEFLHASQYVDLAQVASTVKDSHPDSLPSDAEQQHGGWGHNIGFEGYGPIAMLTGQGALAFALMGRCGIEIDEERHRAAYDFLARGTGSNGYVWYADEVAGDRDWADMGRTGASGIAHWVSPFREHRAVARTHALLIAEHPESFPDTHGSPLMGMGYAALAAFVHDASFERLMAANRWWFVLAECPDGSFAYQPNRDNAGYGADARLAASAVTAFILSLPEKGLFLTGKRSKFAR